MRKMTRLKLTSEICLLLLLGACGSDDNGGSDNSGGSGSGPPGNAGAESNNSSGSGGTGPSQQESECSRPSECDFVVCDCPDGPVNFQGCNVVNGTGVCPTESTCDEDFGACD